MEKLNIFVLEDDTNLRELLCETLEDEGYEVGSAGSGREAVAKITTGDYDLLIVDVRMEGMSGLDAFSVLKQQGIDIACLVITGYATEEDSIRAIRLGVGDYLRKPFDMRQFLLCVKRLTAHYLSHRDSMRRERELEELLSWSFAYLGNPEAENLQAAKVTRVLAAPLGMEKSQRLQLELAALLPAKPSKNGLPQLTGEALLYAEERWDGQGPRGLRGEDIPLAGRILRLARRAATHPDLKGFPGEVDPFLGEQWLEHVSIQGSSERQARRLLAMARALVESGDEDGALAALREAEPLSTGSHLIQLGLLKLRLQPVAERPASALEILERARRLGPREEGPTLFDLGLALSVSHPAQAQTWIEESLSRLQDSGQKARAWLALWTLRGTSLGSPLAALRTVLLPAHEKYLASSLPWLWRQLIGWWMKPSAETAEISPLPLLRRYSSLLQAALVGSPRGAGLNTYQRVWLVRQLADQSWGTAILQQMSQDTELEVRNAALAALKTPNSSEKSTATPLLRIQSFGGFDVSVGGEPIAERTWRGTRNKYLLAYMAATNRSVSEDRLVDMFWDEDLEKGKRGLYNTLSHLRKIMRPAGWQGELEYVQRNRDQIFLHPGADRWHDVEEFQKGVALATRLRQQGGGESPLEPLRQACALYQGPYLENCFMDWALEHRTALENEALKAFLWLAQLEEEAGQLLLSLEAAQRALALDNCCQPAILAVMRALTLLRRPEEAIRTYELGIRRLKTELEIEPGLELFEAYQRAKMV